LLSQSARSCDRTLTDAACTKEYSAVRHRRSITPRDGAENRKSEKNTRAFKERAGSVEQRIDQQKIQQLNRLNAVPQINSR
jgi:hypothetical protein